MKTNTETDKAAAFQAKRDDAGNWYVCKDDRTYCEMTWICGDPELNANLTAQKLNKHASLLAVAEAASRLQIQAGIACHHCLAERGFQDLHKAVAEMQTALAALRNGTGRWRTMPAKARTKPSAEIRRIKSGCGVFNTTFLQLDLPEGVPALTPEQTKAVSRETAKI